MGRFTRNYMLHIAIALTAVGLILTVLSWWAGLADSVRETAYLNFYRSTLHPINQLVDGEVDLIIRIAAPIILLSGGWYLGEQITRRRRFEKLIATEKKSDFAKNRRDLEELARDLPDSYRQRLRDKEKNVAGMR